MITRKNRIYIIAEIGVNHNGKMSLAKRLIKYAKYCGADFVKFQNWKAENLVTNDAKMAKYQIRNIKKRFKQIDLLRPLELREKDYFILKEYARKINIKFISSPFDEESYQFLANKIKCKIIKIPSGEINNFLMLKNVNLNQQKVFISTGMANMNEIANCLNF